MAKKVSFIIPCYNESDNVVIIYNAITKIMSDFSAYSYEFIFSDNASTDNTFLILKDLATKDKRVKIILNNRNFGAERNIMNPLLVSKSDCAIELACDMQDPPELISTFLKHWENGAKVVWGQRTNSDEGFIMKNLRILYYKIIKSLSPIRQYERVTGWGLYDRTVIDNLLTVNDPMPILRNIIPNLGYEVVLVGYHQPIRLHGKSSYNFFSYFDTALSSLTHTSKVPLKLCIYLGLIMAAISAFIALFYLVYKLLYWDTFQIGMAPLVIGAFFIFSIQILFLGIMGEYVLTILDRASFAQYVIEKERINFED